MTDLERAAQRAERERRARLAAEEIAERVTRELYDTVRHLREAEARARIVGETAVEVFTAPLALSETLAGIAASAERALGARRVTCFACAAGGSVVESVHGPGDARALAALAGRPAEAIPGMDGADVTRGVVALELSHASIVTGGREALLGVLRVELAEARLLTDAELLVARSLAALASMALANARLHEQTLRSLADAERRAATDPLTGLANHRAFQERLASEIQRAGRHRRPLALAVVDLDHFKRVNDSHGHQVGDRVLVEAGADPAASGAPDDLVARIGGEEFAWLMPETDDTSAWEAADRARAAIAGHTFQGVGRVTISAGVCDLAAAGEAGGSSRWPTAPSTGRSTAAATWSVRYSPDEVDVLSAEERATRLERRQALRASGCWRGRWTPRTRSTRRHSDRVAEHAVALATALGWHASRIARLHEAGVVHDVGKIGVPDAMLLKPGRLTAEEPRRHRAPRRARRGASWPTCSTRSRCRGCAATTNAGSAAAIPTTWRARTIPDGARVIAVADAWDVMTSERPYRSAVSADEALAECRAPRRRPVRPRGRRRPPAAPRRRRPRAGRHAHRRGLTGAARPQPGGVSRRAAGSGSRSNWVSSRIEVRVRSTPGSSRRRTSRRSMAGGSPTRTFRIRSLVPALDQHDSTSGIARTARTISPRLPADSTATSPESPRPIAAGLTRGAVARDHAAPLELAHPVVDRGRRELHGTPDRRERRCVHRARGAEGSFDRSRPWPPISKRSRVGPEMI